MEAKMLQVFLRVLYTVNNNPQYILAKSLSQVSVIPCNDATENLVANDPAYARAPLKACLAAVCDSSPELLHDPARDFSLYFLDPLEAQPLPTGLAQAPHSTSSPRGVAVALGLMSWALESSDSMNVFVTGTIVPNASLALEVVCALRETKRIPKPMLRSYPPLGPMPILVPSQLPHPVHPLQSAGMTWSCHPQPMQQQTLTRSADFPEVYIGPPRRARGRPERPTSKSKLKTQASASSAHAPSFSDTVDSQSESRQPSGSSSKQRTKPRPPRPPPTHSPFICTPLTHDAEKAGAEGSVMNPRSHPIDQIPNQLYAGLHSQASSELRPTHNPLLALISAISSGSGPTANVTPEQQAALISTLQGLLVANPNLGLPTAGNNSQSNNVAGERDDGDSDIVILDSSTIDTTVFRKGSGRGPATRERDTPSIVNQESPMPSIDGMDSSPLPASTPPSARENASASSQTSTPSEVPESTSTVTADSGMPMNDSSGWVGKGDTHLPDMPSTPTPSRTRKRKLDEYSQGQAHWCMPTFTPSPSPSVMRASGSGRTVTTKSRVQSSSTGGTTWISPPSTRLPSMLDSMRGTSRQSQSSPSRTSGAPHITSDVPSLKRRRTLTEFMAEHEARQNLKGRKQPSSRHKLDVSANTRFPVAPSQSPNLSSASKHAQSSPPRPLFRSSSFASALQSTMTGFMSSRVTSNPTSSTTTLTSMRPPTSTSMNSQIENPLKNFVMPAWARTSTAMLPRLSEEVLARQRAEQEAKKAQISLRRREAARAKRKQQYRPDCLSKDSSDEDNGITNDAAKLQPLLSSSGTSRNVPAPPPTVLPVFASDVVTPIASSPPPSHRQPVSPTVPSTPPRKPISLSGSGSHRTPSKSGSCSLFTPSAQDPISLFTPSTPSVSESQTRVRFTPHSPTALRRSGCTSSSPTKSTLQTPRTPRCKDRNHRTPRSLRINRQLQFTSPSLSHLASQTQTGMVTRPFLLPPSPCAPRTPQRPRQASSLSPTAVHGSGTLRQSPVSYTHTQNVQLKDTAEECQLSHELTDAFLEEDMAIPSTQNRTCLSNSGPDGIRGSSETDPAEEGYASSPLPPSSPLPASPLSSPGPVNHKINFTVPDVDGQRATGAAWLLSDDTTDPTAAWFTDSDAGAWLTETEAWLTDTESRPLPTDSDGAWLSDSDAVSTIFGNLASALPSWLSDEADVEMDGEGGETRATGQEGFGTAAFQSTYEALVEHGGSVDAGDGDATSGPAAAHPDTGKEGPIGSDFLGFIMGERGGTFDDVGTASGVARGTQVFLDGS